MSNTANAQKYWYIFGALALAVLATAWVLLAQIKPADGSAVCRETGMEHQVVIQNNKVTPYTTKAMLCDKITFISKDKVQRVVSFGVHEQHVAYNGVKERLLSQGESLTITLNKSGRYHFHDHHQEEVGGYFEVENISRVE